MNPFEKCLDGQSEMLVACATMLEKYVSKYPQTKGNVKFNDEDMKLWKEKFYRHWWKAVRNFPTTCFSTLRERTRTSVSVRTASSAQPNCSSSFTGYIKPCMRLQL